jgi:hypothetical protein
MVIFFIKIRTGILLLFSVGVSLQYLYIIKFGSFNALEFAGLGIPFLIICGLFISEKSIIHEFNKDNLIKFYLAIVIILFISGVFFPGILYPSHTLLPFFERLTGWYKLLTVFIVFLAASSFFNDEKKINKLLNCMLLSSVLPGSIFIWQIVTGNSEFNPRTGYHFANAFFHHPGVFAYYLLFCFPICLFKHSQSCSKNQKYFSILIILIFLILIFFTYRRGVWLSLFAQIFTYFFLFQNIKHKMIYSYILVSIIIFLSFTQLAYTFQDRFSDISTFYNNLPDALHTNRYDELFSGRWRFFRTNLLYLIRQPIINFMLGNGIEATFYASEKMGGFGGGHNIYLILLVDYGVICFLAYMLFIILLFSKLLQSSGSLNLFISNYSRSITALLVSYLVMGIVTHVLYRLAANWILWGLIGSLLGLLNKRKKSSYLY